MTQARDPDPFDLGRFVRAQDADGTYDRALAELRRGMKASHWMWFVFPQLAGLGRSETSRFYAISGRAEAEAYLRHAVLGPRLVECAEVVVGTRDRNAVQIFGGIDAVKLQSSMTLFRITGGDEHPVFGEVLDRYFDGEADEHTVLLLSSR